MEETTTDPLAGDVLEDRNTPEQAGGWDDDPSPEEMAAIDAEVDALLGVTDDPDPLDAVAQAVADDDGMPPDPAADPPGGIDPAALGAWRATAVVTLTDIPDATRRVLEDTGTHTVGDVIDLYEGWDPAGDEPLMAGLNLSSWAAGELQAAVARTLDDTPLEPAGVLPWVFMKAEAEAASNLDLPPEPPATDADDHTENQVVVIPPAHEPSGEPAATPDPLAVGGNVLGAWRDRELPAFANSIVQGAVAATGATTHGQLDAVIRSSPDVFPLGLSEYQLTALYDHMAKAAAGDPAFVPYAKGWQGPEARAEVEERRKRELEAFDAETAHMMNELFGELVAAKAKHVRLKTEASFAKKDVDEKLKELEELHQKRAEEREYPRLIPSSAPPVVVNEGAEVKSKQAARDRPKKAKEPAAEPVAPGQLSDALSKQLMLEFPLDTHRWERFGATAKMMECLRGGVTKKHGTHPSAAFGDLARFVQPQGDGGFTRYLTDIKGFGEKMLKDWEEVQNKFYQAWGEWLAVAFARERGYIEAEHHTPEANADGKPVDDAGAPARGSRGPGAAGPDDHDAEAGDPIPFPGADAFANAPDPNRKPKTRTKPKKPKPKPAPPKRAGNGNGKPAKPFAIPKPKAAPRPAPRRKPHAANPGAKRKK